MQSALDMFGNQVSIGDLVFYLSASDRRVGRVYGIEGPILHMGSMPFGWLTNTGNNNPYLKVRKTLCHSHNSIVVVQNWIHPNLSLKLDNWYGEWQRKNHGKTFK